LKFLTRHWKVSCNPMKTLNRTLIVSALLTGGLFCTSTKAIGEAITFTVDPTESSLTISASLNAPLVGNVPLVEQAPGSLTTVYGGTVEADVTGTTVEFVGGSSIVASNSGVWAPGLGGTNEINAPANYGGHGSDSVFIYTITVDAAMRRIEVDATSGAIPITGGVFPAQTLVFSFPSNANSVLDYSTSGVASESGSYPLSGFSTNGIGLMGSLNTVGDELVLTIPVDYTGKGWIISQDDLQYTLTGTLVARATVAEPPLEIGFFQVSAGQLDFTINTKVGEHYTILGMTDLSAPPSIVDEFTATENPTVRMVALPILSQQFFMVRRD